MNYSQKIANLESLVDHLQTELTNLNKLLIDCGFTDGIQTLKESIHDLLNGII